MPDNATNADDPTEAAEPQQQATPGEGEADADAPSGGFGGSKRRWFGLGALSFAVSLIVVDGTIVAVATPTIITDLKMNLTDAQWITTIYSLVFASLLITAGRIGDRMGRRRMMVIGIAVFVVASGFAGQADSSTTLLMARFVQGLGAAMILPASLSTVNAVFFGKSRAIAFAVWGSVMAGMAAVGPILGGWLTTEFSWRWAFYINVPLGALVIVLTLLFVDETRDNKAEKGWDYLGIVLSAVGFGLLIFAVIEGKDLGWWTPIAEFSIFGLKWPDIGVSVVPVAFALSFICLASFFWLQHSRPKQGKPVLLDLNLFSHKSFSRGNVAATLVTLGEFGAIFILPLYLQSALGYSALKSGVVILSMAGGAFLAGGVAAELSRALGAKRVVITGMCLEVIGLLGLAYVISASVSMWALCIPLAVFGFGLGLDSAQLTSVILEDVPVDESGQASGVQSTSRQLGSAFGIAILGTALALSLSAALDDEFSDLNLPEAQEQELETAIEQTGGAALIQLREQPGSEEIVKRGSEAYASATRFVILFAALFYVGGLGVAISLPSKPESASDDPDPMVKSPQVR